jgi:rsbT co-antagonist protein RsbR
MEPPDLELAALRAEVSALEEACEELRRVGRALLSSEQRLRALLDATWTGVGVNEDGIVIDVNQRFAAMLGVEKEELIGKSPLGWHAPETHEELLEHLRTGDESPYESICIRKDGSRFPVEIRGRAALYEGRPVRVAIIQDITAQKHADEAARASAVQREVLRAQEALLSALSTPLLPIGEGVLVLPLIGALTTERAEQVLKTLVEGVAARRAEIAILDVTGVADVDAHVAGALIRAARAAELLGAQVILTGLRPGVAARLVHLGIDLKGLVTVGTLQRGVARALSRRRSGAQGDALASEQQRKPTS